MIPGDLLSAFPHRQFHTLPGLLDSWAALPNSYPNALRAMQGGSLSHFYDGLWYDPVERRTHDLPCERRTRYRLSQPDTVTHLVERSRVVTQGRSYLWMETYIQLKCWLVYWLFNCCVCINSHGSNDLIVIVGYSVRRAPLSVVEAYIHTRCCLVWPSVFKACLRLHSPYYNKDALDLCLWIHLTRS